MVSIKPLFLLIQSMFIENADYFEWLRPAELCKNTLTCEDISLTRQDSIKYWRKVIASLTISYAVKYFVITGCIIFWAVLHILYWPAEYFYPHAIHSYLNWMLWLYYILPPLFQYIWIFYQLCYYLKLRLNAINKSLNKTRQHNISYSLPKLLAEHNRICSLIHVYNKYWSKTLLLDAIQYSSAVCLMTFITFYGNIKLPLLRMLFLSVDTFLITFLCGIFFFAARVSYQVMLGTNFFTEFVL